jgi:hypothetical protein
VEKLYEILKLDNQIDLSLLEVLVEIFVVGVVA